MAKKVWQLTAEERGSGSIVSYSADVRPGVVSIGEQWDGHDEIYSNGIAITMPQRVWGEMKLFVDEQLVHRDEAAA
jgi:hypothetical protein